MNKSSISLFAAFALTLAACTQTTEPSPAEPPEQRWGTAERVVQVDRFYFAGQPDAAGFAQARASGVELVIDLREPGERDWNEADVVESAGLGYYNVVVPRGDDLPYKPERMQEIAQILAANPDRDVLVHCASGSRVAGWYAIYLATTQGVAVDDALAAADSTGLLRPSSAAAARAYLETQSPQN